MASGLRTVASWRISSGPAATGEVEDDEEPPLPSLAVALLGRRRAQRRRHGRPPLPRPAAALPGSQRAQPSRPGRRSARQPPRAAVAPRPPPCAAAALPVHRHAQASRPRRAQPPRPGRPPPPCLARPRPSLGRLSGRGFATALPPPREKHGRGLGRRRERYWLGFHPGLFCPTRFHPASGEKSETQTRWSRPLIYGPSVQRVPPVIDPFVQPKSKKNLPHPTAAVKSGKQKQLFTTHPTDQNQPEGQMGANGG